MPGIKTQIGTVLILVLMEHGLGAYGYGKAVFQERDVLILVLMEYGLGVKQAYSL